MTIFIDPPLWPAHGTLFSHVISDDSLAELHDFARRAGMSPRAFDQDHYDVAAHRLPELHKRGAQPVSAGELTRRLRDSGLRIPARERPEKLRPILQRSWQKVQPHQQGTGAENHAALPQSTVAWDALGEDLLQRWGAATRHYHGLAHLAAVLDAIAALESAGECTSDHAALAKLAAWYHDAVYDGAPGEDERASADLAAEQLTGHLVPEALSEVVRLVLLTIDHRPEPGDQLGAVFCDADLEVLARSRQRYQRYVQQVRADYAHVDDDAFTSGRSQVLQRLLETQHLFHTSSGRLWWETPARENVTWELGQLSST